MSTPALAPSPCVHWFVLPVASGPTTVGCCRTCGDVRVFRSRWEGWSDDERGNTVRQETPYSRTRGEQAVKHLRGTKEG